MRRRCSMLVTVWVLLLIPPARGGPILISEVLYDAEGRDDGRTFVELFGPAGFDLAGYGLEAINGTGGGVTHLVDLGSLSIPADGFLVLADEAAAGGTLVTAADFLVADLDLQNGPDSLRILFDGAVVDALGYGTFGPGQVFAGEGTAVGAVGPGASLARRFANVDTDDNSLDFVGSSEPTPGSGDLVGAVPEPESLCLLGLGALLVGARRRRERRKGG